MADENITQSRPKGKDLRSLSFAIGFLRPYGWQIAGSGVALLFTSSVTLSIGYGLRVLVDFGFNEGSRDLLAQAVGLFVVLAVCLAIGTYARHYLVSWIGERVSADIRKAVFNKVLALHPGFFEVNLSGEIQTRITTDTTLIQSVIGSSVSVALRNVLIFFGGIGFMYVTDPRLTGIVLLCVPLLVAPILIFGRRVRRLARSSQDRIADVGSYVGETLKNIKTVQAYNHEAVDRRTFEDHVEAAFQMARRQISQRSLLIAVVIVFVLGALCAMIWIGGQDVLDGRISPGKLLSFGFFAFMVAGAVSAISEVYGELQRAAGATERLAELFEARSEIVSPNAPMTLPGNVNATAGRLKIDGLRFVYESRPDHPALRGIDLEVQPGESVALVGPSGAGKSTLFDLLLRFYDPAAGAVFLDGTDIRELALEELRARIAIVPQQPALFSGNVRENIRYGRPTASEDEVRRAAEAAFADEFIDKLPEKYDSYLGEGGMRLSGGQRQRIAIARAILKDPAILLLDEATSALDAESEYMVQQALDRLIKNRTTLVIAHRLATVQGVDRIAVLHEGEIVAIGKHGELLESSPLYSRLAELQFGQSADLKNNGRIAK